MQRILESKNWKIEIDPNSNTLYVTQRDGRGRDKQVLLLSSKDKIASCKNVYVIGDCLSVSEVVSHV